MPDHGPCLLFVLPLSTGENFLTPFFSSLRSLGGVEWGQGEGGNRARMGGQPPEDQLDRNAGLYTADQVSKRCGEGGLFLFVVFFFFFFFCKSVKKGEKVQRTLGVGGDGAKTSWVGGH